MNHGAISAEVLKPYVSHETYEIVPTHEAFQGRYIYGFVGLDPEVRRQCANQPWYEEACRFPEGWD